MVLPFPYNLFTRDFLSLTNNRKLCYSHRPPWVLQSHQERTVILRDVYTATLNELNPDPSHARHHKGHSPFLHSFTSISSHTTANCPAQLYHHHFREAGGGSSEQQIHYLCPTTPKPQQWIPVYSTFQTLPSTKVSEKTKLIQFWDSGSSANPEELARKCLSTKQK